jgi:hypothetical protein
MRRLLQIAMIALVLVVGWGCSILDPGDREDLRNYIAAMAPEKISELKRLAMNSKAINWLQSRPRYDQVGKLQCREYSEGQGWEPWRYVEPSYTVANLLDCLRNVPLWVTYLQCKDQWFHTRYKTMKSKVMERQIAGEKVECRYEWDFRYAPENVPETLINPDTVSVDDIIDFMIASPAPPPGFAASEFAPLLCPLGAGPGWGCPDTPATESDPSPGDGD